MDDDPRSNGVPIPVKNWRPVKSEEQESQRTTTTTDEDFGMSIKQGIPPVVFHFQPKEFEILSTPEQLREWERLMKEEVGLTADISNLSGSCTESHCAGRSDDCDQD